MRELGVDQLLRRELGLLVVSPRHSRPLGVDGDRRGPQGHHQPQRTPHNLARTIHTGVVTTNDIARARNTSTTDSDGGRADTDGLTEARSASSAVIGPANNDAASADAIGRLLRVSRVRLISNNARWLCFLIVAVGR